MTIRTRPRHARPLIALALVGLATLSACGGGGGGGAATQPASTAAPTPDARNGDYQAYAADGRQYTLTLDFDAKTWKVAGNNADASGTLAASGAGYALQPAGSGVANNAQITQFGDTVVGGLRLAGAVTPFVASRSFVTSVAEAAGSYKFLAVTLDTTAPSNNTIFTGEIVAPATVRFCYDNTITAIADCPAGSVVGGSLSASGADFRADLGTNGVVSFRIAKVGNDKVVLRASGAGTTRRAFWAGVDQAAGLATGTFTGTNTSQQRTTTALSATALSSTLVSEANASTTRTGSGGVGSVPGLLAYSTTADGSFFAMRTTSLGFVFAARNNPVLPGYVEIGKY